MKNIFYIDNPELPESITCIHVSFMDSEENVKSYYHALVSDNELEDMPEGWLKFSELPDEYKTGNGNPRHVFSGNNIVEDDGGF